MNLILLDDAPSFPRIRIADPDPRFRHIRDVLRSVAGDRVRVGNPHGQLGTARIEMIDRSSVELVVEWHGESPERLPIHLLLGHPRPPVLKRLLRDLTAMRLTSATVWAAELSERSYFSSSVWNEIDGAVREGMSQGGHTRSLRVDRAANLSAALQAVPPETRCWFGSLHDGNAVSLLVAMGEAAHVQGAHCVVVGPERGFTERELAILHARNVAPVTLGTRTLRTETAAITLCGALSSVFPDS